MNDQILKQLRIDDLFDLLALSATELLEAIDKKDDIGLRIEKRQLELLLRIIDAKKKEPAPNY